MSNDAQDGSAAPASYPDQFVDRVRAEAVRRMWSDWEMVRCIHRTQAILHLTFEVALEFCENVKLSG